MFELRFTKLKIKGKLHDIIVTIDYTISIVVLCRKKHYQRHPIIIPQVTNGKLSAFYGETRLSVGTKLHRGFTSLILGMAILSFRFYILLSCLFGDTLFVCLSLPMPLDTISDHEAHTLYPSVPISSSWA
jgi:hypothetical protein